MAAEELVEKAVRMAGSMARKNCSGCRPPSSHSNNGRTTNRCVANPASTVKGARIVKRQHGHTQTPHVLQGILE
jgi:hypothetical protein